MAKFYVVGVTKYDPAVDKYDVMLKLEGFMEEDSDLRIQVAASDLPVWVAKIGKYSDEFTVVFK